MALTSKFAPDDPVQQDKAWCEYVESLQGTDLPFEAQWNTFQGIFSLFAASCRSAGPRLVCFVG